MSGLNKNSKSNDETFLTPLEAAYYLEIIPELLFFYTSKNFQKRSGVARHLQASDTPAITTIDSSSEEEWWDEWSEEVVNNLE
ncbi:hypothetical protein [Xenorhabdus bovienii]|uniref:hypothetical protein n=1 Tax=Xenorhabdus bovienii TaxID=40576 RepID=UPI0023B267FE|nr:hypothetical protein [Xenorhabdus bovienii]MDE9465099.1 hypothetical protein [Xenorhabdus bovienii]